MRSCRAAAAKGHKLTMPDVAWWRIFALRISPAGAILKIQMMSFQIRSVPNQLVVRISPEMCHHSKAYT